MKKKTLVSLCICVMLAGGGSVDAKVNLGRLVEGGTKVVQSLTVSDEQIREYVGQYIAQSDKENKVCDASSPYTQRLQRLTAGITQVEGLPLNFKVYEKNEVNAFACADGSVRVYSGLMDVMTDNELLGVIGHEMGHVAHKDTKNAFKHALLMSALKDAVASTGAAVSKLTDSQIGAIGEALSSARFSRKQEDKADDFGYDFLRANGKNPAAMVQAFKRLQSLENASGATGAGGMMNQLFSSHPDTAKRIERMAKRAVSDGYMDKSGNVIDK